MRSIAVLGFCLKSSKKNLKHGSALKRKNVLWPAAKIPIAVAHGDGIGPEIMAATLHILKEAGAPLEYHEIDIGEKVYLKGIPTGIEPSSLGDHPQAPKLS